MLIKNLLTLQEVSNILRINRSSVSRLLKAKELSYVQVGGRKLIDEVDLAMFLENQKVKSDEISSRNGE